MLEFFFATLLHLCRFALRGRFQFFAKNCHQMAPHKNNCYTPNTTDQNLHLFCFTRFSVRDVFRFSALGSRKRPHARTRRLHPKTPLSVPHPCLVTDPLRHDPLPKMKLCSRNLGLAPNAKISKSKSAPLNFSHTFCLPQFSVRQRLQMYPPAVPAKVAFVGSRPGRRRWPASKTGHG